MPKMERCLQKKRSYYGAESGEPLAAWLNGDSPLFRKDLPPAAAVRRIEKIIELLQQDDPDELEAVLKPYRFQIILAWKEPSGRPVPVYQATGAHKFECYPIWDLFELCRLGLHRRIRRCVWCKRWMFARFDHQT